MHGAVPDELRISPDVDRTRRVLRKRSQVRSAAGLVLVFTALDGVGDRDDIGGLIVLHHPDDVAPDASVVIAIEILAGDKVADLVEGVVIDEKRAEQRLLRLDGMRRNP